VEADHNEEIFLVRHACFTGDGNPCDEMERALHAEIDESA